MADREGNPPVGCGYGLLGLCCDSCLLGPCRRSPFDDAGSGMSCRDDSDWMVANNLMERAALESLQAMAAFKGKAEQVADPAKQSGTIRLDPMKVLLTPFSSEGNVLLDLLSPKEAFPFLHSREMPMGSWMTTLLDAMSVRPPARRDPEAILADALRLSAIAVAAEALAREPAGSATRKTRCIPEESGIVLPDSPSPLLLLVSDEDGLQDDGREARETQETQEKLISEIDRRCRKAALIYRLPHVAALPSFARGAYAKWGVPVSMTGSVAVVFSPSVIRGLGALALGFSLVSVPGYPIHGSPLVERYLTQDLKKNFSHAYLTVPPREDLCDTIRRGLAP